jgi:hypothetical protein
MMRALFALVALGAFGSAALAQAPAKKDTKPKPQTEQPSAVAPPVDKGELAPVMAGDGSGLPYELWRGLDVVALEKLISELEIPPRSFVLHALWKRLITSNVTPPSGVASDSNFTALRLEALYRSGLADDAAKELARTPDATKDPVLVALAARNELAIGNAKKACEIGQGAAALKVKMPPRVRTQAILLTGYCAAVAGDASGAGFAAEIAREEGLEQSAGLEALDAISVGSKAKLSPPKIIGLLDYRIVEKAGGFAHKDVLEKGEPALLHALANDASTPADLGLPASDAAAKLNALTPETLAAIYRANGQAQAADALLSAGLGKGGDILRRAALFKTAETEQTPMKKTRLIRAFLDDAKHDGLYAQALAMIAPATAQISPQPELSWFAETGAEIGIASANADMARRWVGLSGGALNHWLALADIAQTGSKGDLSALEQLAVRGRFAPETLHRLATVLESLDYLVPIPLWEAANKTPQPTSGYLPATGVLSELQDASKKKEFGRTVLLTMKALGPNGADAANIISLGDSIRALKRAGLEADARKLGVEALIASWPRTATN